MSIYLEIEDCESPDDLFDTATQLHKENKALKEMIKTLEDGADLKHLAGLSAEIERLNKKLEIAIAALKRYDTLNINGGGARFALKEIGEV